MSFKTSLIWVFISFFFLSPSSVFSGEDIHISEQLQPAAGSFQETEGSDILDAFNKRMANLLSVGRVDKASFDLAFYEMIEDLDLRLDHGDSVKTKSSYCQDACTNASLGYQQICLADSQAAAALAACPTSVYAMDAAYYANVGCQTGALAEKYTCNGPKSKTAALAWLDSAKTRSLNAWNNAAYSYTVDGCTENLATATSASQAYTYFHNARTQMANCN